MQQITSINSGLVLDAASLSAGSDRSYQKLAIQLLDQIKRGELVDDGRLPSERALAEHFCVSRTAIREAIIALEVQGILEVRGGSGIYLVALQAGKVPIFTLQTGPGPFELLRARCILEPEIAAEAALNRTDADLDRIVDVLAVMRQNMQNKLASDVADKQFHLHVAQASGNSIFTQMVSVLWDHRQGPLWKQMEAHFHSPDLRAASQVGHLQVFDAILMHNSDAARIAMRAHIEHVIKQFTEAWR